MIVILKLLFELERDYSKWLSIFSDKFST